MGIGGYIAIVKLVADFFRAYSKAIKAEEAKDGEVSWLDYLTSILDALANLKIENLETALKSAKKQAGK